MPQRATKRVDRYRGSVLPGHQPRKHCTGSACAGFGLLTAVFCGDSLLYLVREGRVEQMNEIKKPRLGTLQPGIKYLAFPVRRSDVIIAVSDGFCLARSQLLNAVQRTLLRPDSMPEAILQAQRDSFDDVTLVCAVI